MKTVVAFFRQRDGERDGGRAIGLDQVALLAGLRFVRAHAPQPVLLEARRDLRDDVVGILAARVVRRHHRNVRQLAGHLAHQRALAGIANLRRSRRRR